MRKLTRSDVLDILAYEKARPALRAEVIARKRHRRLTLGDAVTLIFENRETALFQIQEMMRIERMVDEARIAHEIEIYNILVPGTDELVATLMVDIGDPVRIKPTLDALVGLHRHVHLDLGGRRIAARFDPTQFSDDRISAVQYIRFPFETETRARFFDDDIEARLVSTHPRYEHTAVLSREMRRALREDFEG